MIPVVNEPTRLLFADTLPVAELGVPPIKAVTRGVVRVLMPNRAQVELRARDLDSLVPAGHRARLGWASVRQADLGRMYAGIKAGAGGCGRTPIAPEIGFALWLYATVEGVGSARALARLTQDHDAYRWMGGGVHVNYHTLSDFRTDHGDTLDSLLTDSVAALLAVKAVTLKRVAQDGMRGRASAGAAAFRRRGTLEPHWEAAREQVATLKQQLDADPAARSRRQQAARTRAAREREERVRNALARLPELELIKVNRGHKPQDARACTTEAEATVMKMSDGGLRPAYNAPLATDTQAQVIVGVDVVTVGSDRAPLGPMVEPVTERCSRSPEEW
jgi:transposase